MNGNAKIKGIYIFLVESTAHTHMYSLLCLIHVEGEDVFQSKCHVNPFIQATLVVSSFNFTSLHSYKELITYCPGYHDSCSFVVQEIKT